MVPTRGGCALASVTDHHHRLLLSRDHLHHGLLSLRPIAQGSTVAGDPISLVKGTVGQVLEVLSDRQMSQELRQDKVIEIVAGRFDFTDMARSSLGYNWKKLSPAQQEQFVPLFTAFMEDAYLDKIDSYARSRDAGK